MEVEEDSPVSVAVASSGFGFVLGRKEFLFLRPHLAFDGVSAENSQPERDGVGLA